MTKPASKARFPHRHLIAIEGLTPDEITAILDLAEVYVDQNRQADKSRSILHGRTIINVFYEASTRTRTSFELAGKRLGADVINMSVATSSVRKGETLIDTAMTLNAMRPDALVIRHSASGRGAAACPKRSIAACSTQATAPSHAHPDPGVARRADHPPAASGG